MKTETRTICEIINLLDPSLDKPRYAVMGIAIPGMEKDDQMKIEAEWLQKHGNDLVEIRWPEHILTPKYNGDALYLLEATNY